ncbi:hypothetical protein BGZ63DRAFT_428456 [Mariannaea sp. PMI_226]|nr:hypothetical protein BGZ63DRAFT_428456 [Mariannaea sp. PMI_226]
MVFMKQAFISLALGLGLAGLAAGDALPPNDIPLQCVAICGPVVELTADCSGSSGSTKKREVLGRRGQFKGVVERKFSIIVAAPTTFPFQEAVTTDDELQPTTSSSSIANIPVDLPSSSSSSSSSSNPPSFPTAPIIPSTHTTFANPAMTVNPWSDESERSVARWTSSQISHTSAQPPPGRVSMQDKTEQNCVCLNKSFDVAKVTALCASCVAQAGFPKNNIEIIMDVCNFTALTYSRDKDSITRNVRVKAERNIARSRFGSMSTGPVAAAVSVLVAFVVAL